MTLISKSAKRKDSKVEALPAASRCLSASSRSNCQYCGAYRTACMDVRYTTADLCLHRRHQAREAERWRCLCKPASAFRSRQTARQDWVCTHNRMFEALVSDCRIDFWFNVTLEQPLRRRVACAQKRPCIARLQSAPTAFGREPAHHVSAFDL